VAEETKKDEDIGIGDPWFVSQLRISNEQARDLRKLVRSAVGLLDLGDILTCTAQLQVAFAGGRLKVSYRMISMRDHRRMAFTTKSLVDELNKRGNWKLPDTVNLSGSDPIPIDIYLATLCHTVADLNGRAYAAPETLDDVVQNATQLLGLSDWGFWILVTGYYWFWEFASARMTADSLKNG